LLKTKITKTAIKDLPAGKALVGERLEIRRTPTDVVFYAAFMRNSVRHRDLLGKESQGFNLTRARTAVSELYAKAGDLDAQQAARKGRTLTFREAADEYLIYLEQIAGKNIRQKRQQLRDHLIPFFGRRKAAAVRTADVELYKQRRLEAEVSKATVDRELAVLSHMYRSLRELDLLKERPFAIKMFNPDNRKQVWFSPEDIDRIFEALSYEADPLVGLFVRLGLNTGMRHGEILNIRWEHIDFEGAVIHLPKAKAGARNQPINETTIRVLRAYQGRKGATEGWVFASDGKYGRRMSMKSQFARVMTLAGLDPKRYTAHAMRHTFITELDRAGVSPTEIQPLSGHKSLPMVQRYTHVSEGRQHAAINKVAFEEHDEAV
jgi:integrase